VELKVKLVLVEKSDDTMPPGGETLKIKQYGLLPEKVLKIVVEKEWFQIVKLGVLTEALLYICKEIETVVSATLEKKLSAERVYK